MKNFLAPADSLIFLQPVLLRDVTGTQKEN